MFECSLFLFLPETLYQTKDAPSECSTSITYKLPMPSNLHPSPALDISEWN